MERIYPYQCEECGSRGGQYRNYGREFHCRECGHVTYIKYVPECYADLV